MVMQGIFYHGMYEEMTRGDIKTKYKIVNVPLYLVSSTRCENVSKLLKLDYKFFKGEGNLMKLKRNFLFLLAVLLLLVTVTGSAAPKTTKLVFWTHQRHDMDFMKARIDEFNKTNKDGIIIEYVIQSENYQQNLDMSFASMQAPDIFNCQQNAIYYAQRNMALPLNSFIKPEMKKRFGNMLYHDVVNYYNGKVYSLPNSGGTYRLVYNKDLFKKANLTGPPTTMDQVVEYAKKITEAAKEEKAYGFAANLRNPTSALGRSARQVAWRSGLFYYDYKTGKFDFEPWKPVIMAFKKMVDDGSMFPGSESLDMDPLRSQFAAGKIGMYISANWEVGVLNNQFPAKCDWGAAPLPTVNGKALGKSDTDAAGRWLCISAQTKKAKLAWKFLEYLYRDEFLKEYHERGYGFTVVPSVADIAKSATLKGAADFKLDPKLDGIIPADPTWYNIQLEGRNFNDVLFAVIYGATSWDDAVKDLNKRYNEANERAIQKGDIKKIIIKKFDPSKL